MFNMGDIMKQVQDMQGKMQAAQAELANLEVVGEAGAGLVKITMTGRNDVRKVSIDDSVLSEDKSLLEDLLAAAVNDAVRRVESARQEKMQGFTAGLNLPAGFKFPF